MSVAVPELSWLQKDPFAWSQTCCRATKSLQRWTLCGELDEGTSDTPGEHVLRPWWWAPHTLRSISTDKCIGANVSSPVDAKLLLVTLHYHWLTFLIGLYWFVRCWPIIIDKSLIYFPFYLDYIFIHINLKIHFHNKWVQGPVCLSYFIWDLYGFKPENGRFDNFH